MAAILLLLVIFFSPRSPRQLAANLEQTLHRFRRGDFAPRPDLRGVEWLALAIAALFLELIWIASRY
jgi:hypothetical protein